MAVAAADERVHLHPVDVDGRVLGHAHVRGQARIDRAARAADVLIAHLRADRERAFRLIHARATGTASSSSRLSTVVRCAFWTSTTGDCAVDRHRFLDGAELQVGVDGGREVRRQIDARPRRTC